MYNSITEGTGRHRGPGGCGDGGDGTGDWEPAVAVYFGTIASNGRHVMAGQLVATRLEDGERQLRHLRGAAERAGMSFAEFVVPEAYDILAGRIRLHYLDWLGPTNARTILFLHGGALTAHTWDLTCLALRDTYQCIALDQRGHGESEWSAGMDYSRGAQVADIEHIVHVLGLNDFVLVGMSLGGLNSIEFAGRHSGLLRALVLVDVGPELRLAGTRRIRDFVGSDGEFDSLDVVIDRAMAFNPRRDRELLRASLLNNLRQLPDGKWTWKYDRRHHGRADPEKHAREMQDLAKWVPEISCPTLVVRGAESDVFYDQDAEKLAETLPDGRWVKVPGAGHTVQGDNPLLLVEELRRFLGEYAE
jgi:pimeloyl-ACP methyl ester carboxylesterase